MLSALAYTIHTEHNNDLFSAFHSPTRLTVSTMKGSLTHYNLIHNGETRSITYQVLGHHQCETMIKVNALAVDEKRIIVGGFDETGRGVIEIWKLG